MTQPNANDMSTAGSSGLAKQAAIDRTPGNQTKGRPRPKCLRALGTAEPPLLVEVDGVQYERLEIFKHDSWAATAVYQAVSGDKIVCKFNRSQAIGLLPMRWLGRYLARREAYFLAQLQDVPGIPRLFHEVRVLGKRSSCAVAHAFIEGGPLSTHSHVTRGFFDAVEQLLETLHDRRICYIDLHKQENVIVGDDGLPYLIDFQVSVQLPNWPWLQPLFRALRDCDLYHADKHRWMHGMPPESMQSRPRPAWLEFHRKLGVPLRTLRRRLLVALGVRRGAGAAASEVAPEVGLRRAPAA